MKEFINFLFERNIPFSVDGQVVEMQDILTTFLINKALECNLKSIHSGYKGIKLTF